MTTKTTRPVKIRHAFAVFTAPKGWVVLCEDCESGDMFSPFLRPVVRAVSWSDALWWANWHAREHDLTACSRCFHRPKLDPVRPLDPDTVKVGDRLFRRVPGGWQEAAA